MMVQAPSAGWPSGPCRPAFAGWCMAVAALAGLPLFVASVLSVLSLSAGIGVLLAPKSLLAGAGRLASTQRSWARHWSALSIATPYRPRRWT